MFCRFLSCLTSWYDFPHQLRIYSSLTLHNFLPLKPMIHSYDISAFNHPSAQSARGYNHTPFT
ncbi:hypothetical protein CY34DRAFT_769121 [Suillus luteus UH-Slu-Lm8-n1]|uniref:Uncharacterized protein n=1 Tax=Suillus luteus UH-Slu-Lm8-n1 TaxID=930992 RepID=A0A0D0B6R0_9AGAM|nr:hypothetical protein CY34DRAFT_769121 [Suillus luteus UH-Slu-Lm8-n1]